MTRIGFHKINEKKQQAVCRIFNLIPSSPQLLKKKEYKTVEILLNQQFKVKIIY